MYISLLGSSKIIANGNPEVKAGTWDNNDKKVYLFCKEKKKNSCKISLKVAFKFINDIIGDARL